MNNRLVDGRIPAHTECPFKANCFQTNYGMIGRCYHEGINHMVPFSCATARSYEIIERNKEYI